VTPVYKAVIMLQYSVSINLNYNYYDGNVYQSFGITNCVTCIEEKDVSYKIQVYQKKPTTY
jgi:hypothetical protein